MKNFISTLILSTMIISCGTKEDKKTDPISTQKVAWTDSQLNEAKEMYSDAIKIALPLISNDQSDKYSKCIVDYLKINTTYDKWLENDSDSLVSEEKKTECIKVAIEKQAKPESTPVTTVEKPTEKPVEKPTAVKPIEVKPVVFDAKSYIENLGQRLNATKKISKLAREDIYPLRDELHLDQEKLKAAIQAVYDNSLPADPSLDAKYLRRATLALVIAYVNTPESLNALDMVIYKADLISDYDTIQTIVGEVFYNSRFDNFSKGFLKKFLNSVMSKRGEEIIVSQFLYHDAEKIEVGFLRNAIGRFVFSESVSEMKTGFDFMVRISYAYQSIAKDNSGNNHKDDFLTSKEEYLDNLNYFKKLFEAKKSNETFDLLDQNEKKFVNSFDSSPEYMIKSINFSIGRINSVN